MRAPVLLVLLGLAAPPLASEPAVALREGNRRFHAGDLEGAMEAYAAGYDGADPLLAYNLGAVAHRLGRLPEALLWYRRASMGHEGHAWLRENLQLVRGQLRSGGARNQPGVAGWDFWMRHRRRLLWLGVLCAWGAIPVAVVPLSVRRRRLAFAAVALTAVVAFTAGTSLERIGPRAAVLLADCAGPDVRLKAGSEIRVFPVSPEEGRGWRIPGHSSICPVESVGLVE